MNIAILSALAMTPYLNSNVNGAINGSQHPSMHADNANNDAATMNVPLYPYVNISNTMGVINNVGPIPSIIIFTADYI